MKAHQLLILAIVTLLGACATTPSTRKCKTPEAYFEKYGHVIACTEYRTRDTGDRITQCYIQDEAGVVFRKRLATRGCW